MSFTKQKRVLSILAVVTLLLAPGAALAGPGGGAAAARFDLNGDGKSDVLYQKTSSPNEGLLRNLLVDGTSSLSSPFPALLPSGLSAAGAGNFSAASDGQVDILTRKTTSPNQGLLRLLVLNGTGDSVASNNFPTIVPSGLSLAGIGDLDNAGTEDLLFVKRSAPNAGLMRVYLFNSDRTIKSTGFPGFVPSGFEAKGVADMDGDGNADVVAVKQSSPNEGLVRIFLIGADGLSVKSSVFPTILPSGFTLVGLGFVNGDSRADFILQKDASPNEGLLRVLLTGSGATGIDSSVFPTILPSEFTTVAIGNYDGTNGDDVMARKISGTNAGLMRVFLLNAAGDGVASTGFPAFVPTGFEVVTPRAVIP